MKVHSNKLIVLLLLLWPVAFYGQDQTPPSPIFEQLYRERTKIIKNDTITYKARWFVPDHYKIQFAGDIGFMSVGFGYQLSKRYHPTLYYGYLGPAFGGSTNRVHTVSVKNTFLLTRQPLWGIFTPTAGISINWGHTNNTFDKLPEYYPEKYYFQNKIHLAPFIGGELRFKLKDSTFDAMGLYSEISTLDAYLLEAIRTKYVKPHMILSLALGVTFYLK